MAKEGTFLSDEFVRQLVSAGETDLLIGISSHNNAQTIAGVVQAAEGISFGVFRRERVVIVNADGGSTDATRDVVQNTPGAGNLNSRESGQLRTVHRISTNYANSPSSGRALHTILAAVELLRAKACVVVSASAEDLESSAIERLLKPVYHEQYDYTAPLYNRSKFDGLLARTLLYPLNRALYGFRLRELHAREYAFSGRLASHCLGSVAWSDETALQGAEVRMAVAAETSGFRLCQTFLGARPVMNPAPDPVSAIRNTVGALFRCMEKTESSWISRSGSAEIPSFGPVGGICEKEAPASQDTAIDRYRKGVRELSEILGMILREDTFAGLRRIADLPDAEFRMEDELWVRTIYEFAAACHHAVLARDHVIQALVPIYRGWMASLLLEHAHSTPEEMEAATERLCLEFESRKPYLAELWKTRER